MLISAHMNINMLLVSTNIIAAKAFGIVICVCIEPQSVFVATGGNEKNDGSLLRRKTTAGDKEQMKWCCSGRKLGEVNV